MDYREHLQRLTEAEVQSAQRAVDYLRNNVKPRLEELLDTPGLGIKDWRKRGVMLMWNNILRQIIRKTAMSYKKSPVRSVLTGGAVNEAATGRYNEMIKASNLSESCATIDSWSRLLGVAGVMTLYVPETEEFTFAPIARHNCDVDYDKRTRTTNSLFYGTGAVGPKGGQIYVQWTKDRVLEYEQQGQEFSLIGHPTDNPYGFVPVSFLDDTAQSQSGIWHPPAWEQLTTAVEASALFFIETKFNSRFQAFPALFGNVEIPEGTTVGPDTVVKFNTLPGDSIYLEYKSATAVSVSLKAFIETFETFNYNLAQEWGANLKISGSGTANSGFQLVVDEFDSLEERESRLLFAGKFEESVFRTVKAISDVHGLGIHGDELSVDFEDSKLPVDTLEEWNIRKEQIAMGYTSVDAEWRKDNPEITDEEIARRKAEINGPAGPTFGNIVDEGN